MKVQDQHQIEPNTQLPQTSVIPRSIPDKLYILIAEAKAKRYGLGFEHIKLQGAYSDGQCDTIDIVEEWLRSL